VASSHEQPNERTNAAECGKEMIVEELRRAILNAKGELDRLMLRSVAAMEIAEGMDGHKKIPRDCPMLIAVSKLREDFDALTTSPPVQAQPADAAQWEK